ncbi:hypothetical protein [Spiroplasma culicicola]|uniref:Uncharacterized protein n=1 Tax=Spiroplasma culicicola AES-1 TaxID=1276246 RepID=W6A8C1_9MOLU|nr:hypothetical protein [Spiroplasma culicicola]AHI53242.1 hypothetical protein SCULI_v1c09020 [Spiroplasma culicicola AES-1]
MIKLLSLIGTLSVGTTAVTPVVSISNNLDKKTEYASKDIQTNATVAFSPTEGNHQELLFPMAELINSVKKFANENNISNFSEASLVVWNGSGRGLNAPTGFNTLFNQFLTWDNDEYLIGGDFIIEDKTEWNPGSGNGNCVFKVTLKSSKGRTAYGYSIFTSWANTLPTDSFWLQTTLRY